MSQLGDVCVLLMCQLKDTNGFFSSSFTHVSLTRLIHLNNSN